MNPNFNDDPRLDNRYLALCREAGLAAECMATGATLIGKAHAAQDGLYNQALLNLSIGLERACKLAIIVDYCCDHNGIFPSERSLRDFSHNISSLLQKAQEIANRRRSGEEYSILPQSDIHTGVIQTLSEFAEGTRYYNLDFLVQGRGRSRFEPIKAWYLRVGEPILAKHYKPRQRARHEAEAAVIEKIIDPKVMVMHHTEIGGTIDSVSDGFLHSNRTEIINKYSRMYSMQIMRFLLT